MSIDALTAFKTDTEQQRSQVFLDAFLRRYGLRKFKWSARNVQNLMKQGGADPEEVRRVRREIIDDHDFYRLDIFDHPEVWGVGGEPLVIVGHPYVLRPKDFEILRDVSSLGLTVHVSGDSWYGHGTAHVRVSSPMLENHRP